MARTTHIFDLARLSLSSGEGRRIDTRVELHSLTLGGQLYSAGDSSVPVTLDVARTTSGWALRLRYRVRLDGPCVRCLEPAGSALAIDAREVDQPGGGEDLDSPYVDGDDLRLHEWARDALALALPERILCAHECRGLCPVCGTNLNEAEDGHAHQRAPDPRWAKLGELRFE